MRGIDSNASSPITLTRSAWRWWSDIAERSGSLEASRRLFKELRDFLRDSTPQRRRQRYGDAEFDWNHRVNTTSATVGFRDRLLGVFHSPYQPTEADLFHEMLGALLQRASVNFSDYLFIDLGSGKGRTLLMASDYPFRRVVGVELLPALHYIAQENLQRYRGERQKCFTLEAVCADATHFPFPLEPTILYLFNPFPEDGLRRMLVCLRESLRMQPRNVYLLYHNPLLEELLMQSDWLQKLGGTNQYSIYAADRGGEAKNDLSCGVV